MTSKKGSAKTKERISSKTSSLKKDCETCKDLAEQLAENVELIAKCNQLSQEVRLLTLKANNRHLTQELTNIEYKIRENLSGGKN